MSWEERPRDFAEWTAIIDWLDAHGFKVLGFDPGFVVSVNGHTFYLPLVAARQIMRIAA